MSFLSDMAAAILAVQGESVLYTPLASDADAEAVELQAVVTRHGLGPCPDGWPGELFPAEARHAEVRLAAADVPTEPRRGDEITLDSQAYKVRHARREPTTGPEPLWWVCRAACQQRGKY